jgi:hypothetical protein
VVDDESHIIVDVAITEHETMTSINETGHTLGNFGRKREISKFYKVINDIAEQVRAKPDVNFRHFFIPSEPLGTSLSELDFRNETTWGF